jgi:hypothetical protein
MRAIYGQPLESRPPPYSDPVYFFDGAESAKSQNATNPELSSLNLYAWLDSSDLIAMNCPWSFNPTSLNDLYDDPLREVGFPLRSGVSLCVCRVPCWSHATIGFVLELLEWRRAMTSLRPCEILDEMGVDAISSPVEAESEVRCKVYDLAVFSSPMRYIVVVVAMISEMMNCVL